MPQMEPSVRTLAQRSGLGPRDASSSLSPLYAPLMADQEVGIMRGFSAVDATVEVAPFVTYLDQADQAPLIMDVRARVVDALMLRSGEAVVDVGCGTGTALFALAPRVGEGGRLVGVDASAEMVAVAEQRRPSSVEVICASATALPFADGVFDAYRAERVYQHLDQPNLALAEAYRVLRPGGRLVIAEPDWEGLLVDEPEPMLLRRAVTAVSAGRPGATVGRRLRRLLLDERFGDVQVEGVTSTVTTLALADALILGPILDHALTLGVVEAGEIAGLRQGLEERDARGVFFLSLPTFIASATRP
jgi:SAM-dependent methyltransferase